MATVDALVEAATYILSQRGGAGFTANRIAERAGVNIASFYQYFPNKEALLFLIAQRTWDRQLARLAPLLSHAGPDKATSFRDFIREFFMIEASEAGLRRALRVASVDLRQTEQFQALMGSGDALTRRFLIEAVQEVPMKDLDFVVRFIVLLTTSFAERTTDEGTTGAELIRQADLITEMLVEKFRIGAARRETDELMSAP